MAEHLWSVLCEKSTIDKDTNKISLSDIVENLHVFKDPEEISAELKRAGIEGIHHPMELVSLWMRTDPGRGEKSASRVRILSPKKKKTISNEFELDLTDYSSLRTRWKFNGIPWHGVGRYWFVVEEKPFGTKSWRVRARIPLNVEHKKAQEEQGGGGG